MNKTKIKILGGLLALFLLAFVGLFFYISSKITPDEVRKHTLTFLNKTFPEANVQLGEVHYSLGTSLKFKLNNLEMKLKDASHTPLASVALLDVKIPLWAIITRGGTIGINIDGPIVHYVQSAPNVNNWTLAMKGASTGSAENTATENKEQKGGSDSVALPGLLSRGTVDLKLTNLLLKYSTLTKSKGEINISRFFIKNLNFKTPTAFEVASQIHQRDAKGEELVVEAVLIGQVNINQYIQDQELSSSMVLNITSAKIPGLKKEFSALKADLKLQLHKDGKIDLEVDSGLGSLGTAKLQTHVMKEQILVDHLDVDLSLKDALEVVGKEGMVNSENSRIKLKGSVEMVQNEMKPALEFNVTPAANILLAPKVRMDFTSSGSIANNILNVKLNGKLLQGALDIAVNSTLNLKAEKAEEKLGPLNVSVALNNIQIPKEDLHELLYKNKKGEDEKAKAEKEEGAAQTAAKAKAEPAPSLPKVVANIKWSNVSVGGEPFQGDMRLTTQKNNVASDNLKFTFSRGKGAVKFNTDLLAQGAQITKLDAQVQTLNLDSFMPFLPKNLESLKGTFSGQVKGDVESYPARKLTKYNLQVNVSAKDGELKKLNVVDYVKDTIAGIPILKDKVAKDGINFSNKFDSLDLSGNFKQDHFQISKFSFVSNKGQLIANGSGEIYPLPNLPESALEFEVVDKSGKLSQELKKNIGSEALPLRVAGPQYSMKPDIAYTLKKVSKGAIKTQGKEQLKKFGEKLLEDKKDDIKNIFKGLLKK